MKNKHTGLRDELLQAGAKEHEIDQLIATARQLRRLKAARTPRSKTSGQSWWSWRRLAPLGAVGLVGLVSGASFVMYAQTSLPGSWPYATKRLSENVAVAVDPDYRATLMMRRAQEVKELVGHHANSQTVLATLADYTTEASAYKSAKSANYAAFEYCKDSLEQAMASAPNPERQAIASTLASLQDI